MSRPGPSGQCITYTYLKNIKSNNKYVKKRLHTLDVFVYLTTISTLENYSFGLGKLHEIFNLAATY